jgi:hypothetical protein
LVSISPIDLHNGVSAVSQVQELLEHYKQVRARLRNPDNAVPDTGINLLSPRRSPPIFQERLVRLDQSSPVPKLRVPYVPFRRKNLTLSPILDFCAREFGISRQDIRSGKRVRRVCFPRMVAIYLGSKLTGQGYAGMGRYLKKDHTTMIYCKRVIQKMVDCDPRLAAKIHSMEERLLADFHRASVPANPKPYLGTEKATGNEEIGFLSAMDQGS